MSNFFCSSIGKKLLMSLAGLFLVVFLLVHLGINLLILGSDNGEAFRVAVEFMGSPVIKVMEIFLMAGFAIHIIWALILFVQNMMARPQGYAITNHSQTSFFSKYMIHTGAIIFTFLVLHFINFYFVKLGIVPIPEGADNKHDFYNMVINLFKQPVYSIIYVAFMAFLSFHMLHAFQSAFQTLGINHKKYSPIIKYVGIAYSILVPLGFAIIPVYVYFWM
ncbi:MAG TPA: succinate dehydrogenase cytochrome b subunit [Bacteroidales bacterium]|nr:succinate dehydrogenase cytochrome b subunit [Bacteroidales bacterium]